MLDLSRYEYKNLLLPNIKVAVSLRDRSAQDRTLKIHPNIGDFIFQAARQFPTREFICGSPDYTADSLVATHFTVYENREDVGDVWWDSNSKRGVVYCLRNKRIENQRQRGECTKTKDVNKAVKLLGKFFSPKTLTERIEEARDACDKSLSSTFRDKKDKFYTNYNFIVSNLAGYLMNDWEKTKEAATTRGVDVELLEQTPGKYEDYMIISRVYKRLQDGLGALVVINGNDYAVSRKDEMKIYSSEDLPEWIKRGVGMLKLIEPKNVIGGVGFKISADSFYVIEGEQ
jgi:hypothetical protein